MNATLIKSAANNNVVSNDVSVSANKTTSSIDTLFRLESTRKQWEEGAYKTSNQQLYAILAECYAYAGDLSFTEARQRTAALEAFYKQRAYRIKKDTHITIRVVRAVFGDIDRRRTSTYSLVLRAAKAANVLPMQLAAWIEEHGGVQEIRMSRSATFVSPKQKVEIAQQSFSALPVLASVKSEQLSQLADAGFNSEDCVLLATQMDDGSFAVRALLRGGVAVNAAFAALYADKQKEQKAALAEAQAANDADGSLKVAA